MVFRREGWDEGELGGSLHLAMSKKEEIDGHHDATVG